MQDTAEMQRVARMSVAELERQRAALQDKLTELETGLRQLDKIAVETAPDAMDESAFANDRDFAVERLVQITALLVSVRAALERISGGGYGVCLGCGRAIGAKRLAALPWAAHCRACQENLDMLQDTSFEHLRTSVLGNR